MPSLSRLPLVGALARRASIWLQRRRFGGSRDYWERRYAKGDTSWAKKYNAVAAFKAEVINGFLGEHGVTSAIEYGSGDGNQLALIDYPKYLGFDVSRTAVETCRDRFKGDRTKEFKTTDEYAGERADMTVSLDVIYHLVEDPVFEGYMRRLFDSAERFVVIFSNNTDVNAHETPHIRRRQFTRWVDANTNWQLVRHVPNKFAASEGRTVDFFIYGRG